jgi:SAM-dependent methyltransferase
MRVRRNFEHIYATEDDPWSIGEADSERYSLYVERILDSSSRRDSVLELGCGFGALLARLHGHFERLVGVELSARAVERGRERHPFIEFSQGSLANLGAALPDADDFDTIVVSDVFYYLKERDRRTAIAWIAQHLAPAGLAFLAGWSPGGRYLTPEEFRNLVERELAIESEQTLDTQHVLFTCRPRRTLVALTVDYETWQPQLEGVELDWNRDVFEPTQRLLDVFDAAGATLTIFAEMGEYMWLSDHRPELARRMEQQWRDAVTRGHDVQLHLHPNWLPEMRPTVTDGRWQWDMRRVRAADYPGDLGATIARCKTALETVIRAVSPRYEVLAYRAGAYEAQPFRRLYDALLGNGIWCDSSVLPGDRRAGRHYDYAYAYTDHQPWFAGRHDPQLKAPPSERAIVELPIFTPRRGERWTFDNDEGARFAGRLLERLAHERRRPSSESLRRRCKLRTLLNRCYGRLQRARPLVNRLLPRRLAHFMAGYERERLVSHQYFVLVGHSKANLDFDAMAAGLRALGQRPGVELVSLSELAHSARAELERVIGARDEHQAERRVRCGHAAQTSSDDRSATRSDLLHRLLPLDRRRVLDAGCGDGAAVLARHHPWVEVVGANVGADCGARAARELATERAPSVGEDPGAPSFVGGEFDCVYADTSLEHAFDVDGTLGELHRALGDGGCILAALTPDGLNPDRTCDNHTWKTIPADVRERFLCAGFVDVEIRSVDVYRKLGLSPFPPSDDRMLYIRAWKRARDADSLDRVRALTSWAYGTLDPERAQTSDDPLEILAGGYAWCWGYAVVLGEALAREGYNVRWVTMVAEDHPLGLGDSRRNSHEVLEVTLDGRRRAICDPMVGIVFEASLGQLLANPSRADVCRAEDDRYRTRSYALYSTSTWYKLVRRVAVQRYPGARLRYVTAERLARASETSM